MNTINNLLKNANLYSIEFTGFFSLKFSIFQNSTFYKSITDIVVEFNSGFLIYNGKNEKIKSEENIFKLFGLNVLEINVFNGVIKITFENNYTIESIIDEDQLVDRLWVIRTLDNTSYIINDSGNLFMSEIFK